MTTALFVHMGEPELGIKSLGVSSRTLWLYANYYCLRTCAAWARNARGLSGLKAASRWSRNGWHASRTGNRRSSLIVDAGAPAKPTGRASAAPMGAGTVGSDFGGAGWSLGGRNGPARQPANAVLAASATCAPSFAFSRCRTPTTPHREMKVL